MAFRKSRHVEKLSYRTKDLDPQTRGEMKALTLELLILLRLLTNEGLMLENRRPIPKKQPPEIIRFIRRPAKRGMKLGNPSFNQKQQ
jgi:hypothetical protein